jgi:glycine C-acetyltransferase
MPLDKLTKMLNEELNELKEGGRAKGKEMVIVDVKKAEGEKGPRYYLEGYGDKGFIKMNSNAYLGMSLRSEIIKAEEETSKRYGAGPGAVRFISGTYIQHIKLERKLAEFHNREGCIIFSSAYSTVMGIISPLITDETVVISDELNHNCIINAVRLSRPKEKAIYKHLDMQELEEKIKNYIGKCKRLMIVTDGVFSMRGDYAPLDKISELSKKYDSEFEENIFLVVDDSHGVGAFGKTGRGTEEYTNADGVDILVSTLGKALGVNGGYMVSNATLVEYMREKAPFYIYSNPTTPPEAAAALKALEILDSDEGLKLLQKLNNLTRKFETGLKKLGYEIIESPHPIVPVMIRDTKKTSTIVKYLIDNGILATGLNYPVVPKGDEEIRFQISCDHTEYDIDYVLKVLKDYKNY